MVDPEEEKARQAAEEAKKRKEAGKQEETGKGLPSPTEPKLFKLLGEIKDAIQGKEYQEAHHIDRLIKSVDALTEAVNNIRAVPLLAGKTEEKGKDKDVILNKDAQTAEGPKASALEEIKVTFPNDMQKLLTFEDKGDHIRVAPRQFLGSENFAKIASIVRDLEGEYVSAGKESHFKVGKK